MLTGKLPAPAIACAAFRAASLPAPKKPHASARAQAETSVASRRAVLTGFAGFAIGAGAMRLGQNLLSSHSGQEGHRAEAQASKTSSPSEGQASHSAAAAQRWANAPVPAWAQRMLEMDETELLLQAGEFERLSARHVGEGQLGPSFRHLFVVARQLSRPESPQAAACAIRSLERCGRLDLIDALTPSLLRIEGYEEALHAAREAFRRNPSYKPLA
jgi:hypothetical protein